MLSGFPIQTKLKMSFSNALLSDATFNINCHCQNSVGPTGVSVKIDTETAYNLYSFSKQNYSKTIFFGVTLQKRGGRSTSL